MSIRTPPNAMASPSAAPSERENQILGEQQPAQPLGARAERGAHRELVLAPHAAHEREVRDVRARDDQHERRPRPSAARA